MKRTATAWEWLTDLMGGIGWRLLVRVLFVSSVITLLLTMMELYLDYRRDIHAIELRMSEIESGYRQSLGEGLWRVNQPQLRLQVEGILRLPDISYVELREAADQTPLVVTAGFRQAVPSARREFKIFYKVRGTDQLIGNLVVEATFDRIYRRLLDTAVIIMVGQAVKTFIVSFFILFLVHRLVTRHLTAIARKLGEHDLLSLQTPLRLDRHSPRRADELDHLVGAFNQRETGLRDAQLRNLDAQMQLAHANRVATMGQLAASLAHEVNQPIAAALINAGTARRWLEASPPNVVNAMQSIERIVADGGRAADIVGRIRDLAKKAPAYREYVDINEVVVPIIGLLRSEMSNNKVSLKTRLTDGLPFVWGDTVQLQQVLLNLIMNAIEAMSGVTERPRQLLISTCAGQDDRVIVTVSDDGSGLRHADPERIFEAFYTTKPSGLGMGLSICRSIVEAHGGELLAAPNEPHGAVFRMTLPTRKAALQNGTM